MEGQRAKASNTVNLAKHSHQAPTPMVTDLSIHSVGQSPVSASPLKDLFLNCAIIAVHFLCFFFFFRKYKFTIVFPLSKRMLSRCFLLAFEQGQKRHTGSFNSLRKDSGNITNGVTIWTKSSNKNFMVFFSEGQAAITGHRRYNLPAILDELYPDTPPSSRI